ncbi:hypothetical protein HK096_002444 [Nowakowskiella sp. JEL0078]|nr:hypothetical protein HK096_002444 [Nowakowskiella sp. JEL0078]
MFVDGVNRSKPVSLCLILHWFLRSLGAIIFKITEYVYQNDKNNLWKFSASLPVFFWLTGELMIDSYPFQKAWTLASGKPKYRILSLVGFIPLVISKISAIFFRYIDPLALDDKNSSVFNSKNDYFVSTLFLLTAWSDICCCVVIVSVSSKTFKKVAGGTGKQKATRNSPSKLMGSFILTTEVRMVICTIMATISAILVFLGAVGICPACAWKTTASPISNEYVYCIYYLDYLFLKYKNTAIIKSTYFNVPDQQAVEADANIQPLITGQMSSAVSLEASPRAQGGITTDESVVYGRSIAYESDQTGSAYEMEQNRNYGKKKFLI